MDATVVVDTAVVLGSVRVYGEFLACGKTYEDAVALAVAVAVA